MTTLFKTICYLNLKKYDSLPKCMILPQKQLRYVIVQWIHQIYVC